jgi:hypothetical protein
MDQETAFRLILAFAATVVYCMVGAVVGRRDVTRESQPANRAFQAWWYGLALITLYSPLMLLLDALSPNVPNSYFQVRFALLEFVLIGIVIAIGALVYYLLYVYTGKSNVFWPVAIYHLLVLTWLVYIIAWAHPVSWGPTPETADLPNCNPNNFCYENDLSGGSASIWLSLSITLPILLSAVAYFALFFRVSEPAQKYRIALVAGGLIIWFGTSLLASIIKGDFETTSGAVKQAIPLSQWRVWSYFVAPTISLLASVAVLLAYRPPRAVRALLARSGG